MAGDPSDLPPEARAIVLALPPDGSTVGNGRLRDLVGLESARYSELTGALKTLGLAVAGRGRGGSLALTEEGQRVRSELPGATENVTELPGVTGAGTAAPSPSTTPGAFPTTGKGWQGTTDIYDVADRLWATADELRANSSLKASEYSVPVLGLIFLRFADSRFTQAQAELEGTGSARRRITKANYQAQGVLYLPSWPDSPICWT